MKHISARTARRVVAFLVIALALVATNATGAQAATTSGSLSRGQTLNVNDRIVRANGVGAYWFLQMQSDGNLVLYYDPWYSKGIVCWASNTVGHGAKAVYTSSGDLQILDAHSNKYWSTGANSGTTVDINPQGVLYVGYRAMNSKCPAYV